MAIKKKTQVSINKKEKKSLLRALLISRGAKIKFSLDHI